MTKLRASAPQFLHRAARVGRALRDDARATAAVEAALILPIALTMFALLIYGAEAFAIQRKVTLTARTVTDLVTQTTPTMVSSQPSVHAIVDRRRSRRLVVGAGALRRGQSVDGGLGSAGQRRPDHRHGAMERALQRRDAADGRLDPYPADRHGNRPGGHLSHLAKSTTLTRRSTSTFRPRRMTLHDTIYLTPRASTSITS